MSIFAIHFKNIFPLNIARMRSGPLIFNAFKELISHFKHDYSFLFRNFFFQTFFNDFYHNDLIKRVLYKNSVKRVYIFIQRVQEKTNSNAFFSELKSGPAVTFLPLHYQARSWG